jgi:hypothetical protein
MTPEDLNEKHTKKRSYSTIDWEKNTRISLTISRELKALLEKEAEYLDYSLNRYLIHIIKKREKVNID